MKKFTALSLAITVFLFLLASCDRKDEFNLSESGKYSESGKRFPVEESRRVFLLYSAGYNDLCSYLKQDVEDICGGFIPEESRSNNVALAMLHHANSSYDYTPTNSYLVRYFKDLSGNVVRDTLITYPDSCNSASPGFMAQVLEDVKDLFPAKSYGMLLSSHGSGWLPVGYYNGGGKETPTSFFGNFEYNPDAPFHYIEEELAEGSIAVKSVTNERRDGSNTYEMDIKKFAASLPYHLEYIIFDACLMGGVEVAYELKDKCDYLAFSQTEILSDGFFYETVLERLIGGKESDVMGVCQDYFNFYNEQSGVRRSATISMVNCNKLDKLSLVCSEIFKKHETELPLIQGSDVQRYYRYGKHYFYDLRDIICHLSISDEELAKLDEALSDCLPYRKATPKFLEEFTINNYCGLSSYLPSMGSIYLNNYYRDFKWNQSTGLVK